MTDIIRYQVKVFGGGYITKNGHPLRFDNVLDVERWILNNENNYKERLCSVPILDN